MASYETWDDDELVEELVDIDQSDDADFSTWEKDFVEDVCYGRGPFPKALSEKQRAICIEIIRKNS